MEVRSDQALASTQMQGCSGLPVVSASLVLAAPREGGGTLAQQERGAHGRLLGLEWETLMPARKAVSVCRIKTDLRMWLSWESASLA